MRPVRVQIAGVSSQEEADFIAAAGGDAIGLTLRLPTGVHDDLTEAKARSIVAGLPPFFTAVVITYVRTAREAADLCRYVGATVVQLHAGMERRELEQLRVLAPHLKIILPVMVTGPEVIDEARGLARSSDALILDTLDTATGARGATGQVHDWTVSRAIVEAVKTPVILAGGLTPENVAAAIGAVQPWGVDVHTGVEDSDQRRDFTRIRAFLGAVQAASAA